MTIIDINNANDNNISNITSDKNIGRKIIEKVNKQFLCKKQDLINIVGIDIYRQIKNNFVICPLDILFVPSDKFLDTLLKYANNNIIKKIKDANYNENMLGYNYILAETDITNNVDTNLGLSWYKNGETRRHPNVRGNEWRCKVLFSKPTSCRKKIELLVRWYLSFSNIKRETVNDSSKYEIEWFFVKYNLLKRTVEEVLKKYDPYHKCFELYDINEITQLNENYIKQKYKKLALEFHPDKHLNDTINATEKFKLVSEYHDELIKYIKTLDSQNVSETQSAASTSYVPQEMPKASTKINKFDHILTKNNIIKINETIKKYTSTTYRFHVDPRRYLFSILKSLFNADNDFKVISKDKQILMNHYMNIYDTSEYFHIDKRIEFFNCILSYM